MELYSSALVVGSQAEPPKPGALHLESAFPFTVSPCPRSTPIPRAASRLLNAELLSFVFFEPSFLPA